MKRLGTLPPPLNNHRLQAATNIAVSMPAEYGTGIRTLGDFLHLRYSAA